MTDCAICGRRIRASQDVVIVGGMTVHGECLACSKSGSEDCDEGADDAW
ncbi:MAG: hypothetical protein WBL92_05015 [Methanothrix sp.]